MNEWMNENHWKKKTIGKNKAVLAKLQLERNSYEYESYDMMEWHYESEARFWCKNKDSVKNNINM